MNVLKQIKEKLIAPVDIAPLVGLRIIFGTIMCFSIVRFLLKGWVEAFYIRPKIFFPYPGLEWIKPLGTAGMYCLFGLILLCGILLIVGLYYRLAAVLFFCCFTYVELIDKTTYLNHYYFISIFAFLMICVPANRHFSLDAWRKPQISVTHVPAWCISIFKIQLLLVYFFAGLSKCNADWLMNAMPLRIWLPTHSQLPLVGPVFGHVWTAYLFSWCGMLFDLLIGFFLLQKRFQKAAYSVVVIFHVLTAYLFKIGMFPYIMIGATLIFFPETMHRQFIATLQKCFGLTQHMAGPNRIYQMPKTSLLLIRILLSIHFSLQLLLPFRYLLYPGKLYWTEEGYRFSWRVMLMEKGGTIFFHVKDPVSGHQTEINNTAYLTSFQENMMSTQPDMMLQYAHFLAGEYQRKGIRHPIVTAESYVTLNGSGSRLFLDSTINLATEREHFLSHKKWILPFIKKKE